MPMQKAQWCPVRGILPGRILFLVNPPITERSRLEWACQQIKNSSCADPAQKPTCKEEPMQLLCHFGVWDRCVCACCHARHERQMKKALFLVSRTRQVKAIPANHERLLYTFQRGKALRLFCVAVTLPRAGKGNYFSRSEADLFFTWRGREKQSYLLMTT